MMPKEKSLERAIDSLGATANRIADERNLFKKQCDDLAGALQELLDATPTSCEDRALNEAQAKAGKLLKEIRVQHQPTMEEASSPS